MKSAHSPAIVPLSAPKALLMMGYCIPSSYVKTMPQKAREFFDQSVYNSKIILHTGSALNVIPHLAGRVGSGVH